MLSLSLLILLIVFFALVFDYINGFHDTANAIATVVSTRVLSPRNAIIMAAVLNFGGALMSTQVAKTVAGGLVDTARFMAGDIQEPAALAQRLLQASDPVSRDLFEHLSPESRKLLALHETGEQDNAGLRAALTGELNQALRRADLYCPERFAAIALKEDILATAKKAAGLKAEKLANLNRKLLEAVYPRELSSSQQPFQLVILGALLGAIAWNLITWYYGIPSSSSHALIGGLCGAAIMHGGLSLVLWEGILKKVVIPLFGSPAMGFVIGFLIMTTIIRLLADAHPEKVSGIFRHMQVFSAAAMALTHGLNDAQKSMGIITMALVSGRVISEPVVPTWVVLSCAVAMALGTAAGGWRIIKTMGHKIIRLEPVHGFAAETSSAIVLFATSHFGMPVSTTHVISGSIFGVGSSKRLSAVRWGVAQNIVTAWVLTLPAAALVAALSYKLLVLMGIH